ncbi:unnamed protein product [Diplocarpon coronariae]
MYDPVYGTDSPSQVRVSRDLCGTEVPGKRLWPLLLRSSRWGAWFQREAMRWPAYDRLVLLSAWVWVWSAVAASRPRPERAADRHSARRLRGGRGLDLEQLVDRDWIWFTGRRTETRSLPIGGLGLDMVYPSVDGHRIWFTNRQVPEVLCRRPTTTTYDYDLRLRPTYTTYDYDLQRASARSGYAPADRQLLEALVCVPFASLST